MAAKGEFVKKQWSGLNFCGLARPTYKEQNTKHRLAELYILCQELQNNIYVLELDLGFVFCNIAIWKYQVQSN